MDEYILTKIQRHNSESILILGEQIRMMMMMMMMAAIY